VENRAASVAALAQTVLMGMDMSKEFTSVQSQTLALICRSLIELAYQENPTARAVQSAAGAFVASRISGVEGR
jgi:hypothetical protein